tara:strand:+ start:90 stop:581 length:492 start_codon:yes stop_codon:yes gene_type:complete
MHIGIVSDTHNNLKNLKKIIDIFNDEKVDLVIHTGDITKASTLREFSKLNCKMKGVFGNSDRLEEGLQDACEELNFDFVEPPFIIKLFNRDIAIFHEPDSIEEFIVENQNFDIILHGHTHRYREEVKNKTIIFNPGESAGFLEGKNAIGVIDLNDLAIRRIFF